MTGKRPQVLFYMQSISIIDCFFCKHISQLKIGLQDCYEYVYLTP